MSAFDDATEIMIEDGQEIVVHDEQECGELEEIACRTCKNTQLEVFHSEEYGRMARCWECGDEFCI